ncbi:hypothetical protein A0J61_02676 [Choanephora cucurbitarum]|uniref:Uncharacterized protein n=1 Tax=Choanephora cucurbitarum TaxID=101091 RepID=A0A1C7NPU0_9FUNG|nr:hypothetical protein A0J61_02676 [Choanephora cucurbitarum]
MALSANDESSNADIKLEDHNNAKVEASLNVRLPQNMIAISSIDSNIEIDCPSYGQRRTL